MVVHVTYVGIVEYFPNKCVRAFLCFSTAEKVTADVKNPRPKAKAKVAAKFNEVFMSPGPKVAVNLPPPPPANTFPASVKIPAEGSFNLDITESKL